MKQELSNEIVAIIHVAITVVVGIILGSVLGPILSGLYVIPFVSVVVGVAFTFVAVLISVAVVKNIASYQSAARVAQLSTIIYGVISVLMVLSAVAGPMLIMVILDIVLSVFVFNLVSKQNL
jgi:hypothetical protein